MEDKKTPAETASLNKQFSGGEDTLTLQKICPLLVGVSGGSASGKTTLCKRVKKRLGIHNCFILSQDSFYKGLPQGVDISEFNFDHPDALDFDLCYQVLLQLMNRQPAKIPNYDFKTSQRTDVWDEVQPADLILLEGIHAFYDERLVKLMNLKIFVSCDDDIRLYRRVVRDVNERGRHVTGILYVYHKFVKPAFNDYIRPCSSHADIIVPGIGDNNVAINFVVDNLRVQLSKFEEMNINIQTKNIYFPDILDNVWLNVDNPNDKNQEEEKKDTEKSFQPSKSSRIYFLRDTNAKQECLNLFNLITQKKNKFSKTTFSLVLGRFTIYGIKIYKRKNPKLSSSQIGVMHIELDIAQKKKELEQYTSLGLIIHFLTSETVENVKQKVKSINERYPNIKTIYLIALFSDVHTMTSLIDSNENIHIINILCVVKQQLLLDMFAIKCNHIGYDFAANAELVSNIQDLADKEIQREEKGTGQGKGTYGEKLETDKALEDQLHGNDDEHQDAE